MIALVDYGAGNLTSVRKALAALGAEFMTPAAPADLVEVAGIIVPGVGHFGATRALDEAWRRGIRQALNRGAALFGICLGMQWLFDGSAEADSQGPVSHADRPGRKPAGLERVYEFLNVAG